MKYLNIRNIIIVLLVLAVVHFSVGLLISPKLGKLMVEKMNQYSRAKISVERVNIWPLTFSFFLKNLKIFDPESTDKRIAEIKEASVRVSPLGLLSKRLVIGVKIKGAQVNLQGEPDGTFNIQKLAEPKTPGKPIELTGIREGVLKNKDWFAKGYDLLKKKFSGDALKKEKAQAIEAKKITKTVDALPRGRRVHFKSKDSYLLEIKSLGIADASLDLRNQDGRSVQIEDVRIELRNAAFDPELGFRLGVAQAKGKIKNAGVDAGSLTFVYKRAWSENNRKVQFNLGLKEVDLDAVRFIYENSLPIEIVRGTTSMTSETLLDQGNIHSVNQISLGSHELKPKGASGASDIFMPMPLLCEALNGINPLRLDFTISGTVENPEFKGLMRSLAELVKPSMKNLGEVMKGELKRKGVTGMLEAVSGKKEDKAQSVSSQEKEKNVSAEDVVNSLQSIFGQKK